VLYLLDKPNQVVRAEPTTTCAERIDTNYSTTFTLLLIIWYEVNVKAFVDKGGYSSNCQIVQAWFLPLMAKLYHLTKL